MKINRLKGIYLLMLRLDAALTDLAIGRLGRYDCAAGYYLYVGSAFGSGGLAARLAHHERAVKTRPHWHIDYFRAHALLIEAWCVGTTVRRECCWVEQLAATPDLSYCIPRFGASDNGCVSHLLYSHRRPPSRLLTETMLACFPPEPGQALTVELSTYT